MFLKIVEARKSLVDRNIAEKTRRSRKRVEARKSLVDRNTADNVQAAIDESRGSQEPRGSKFSFANSIDAKYGRGSQEPRGSKLHMVLNHQSYILSRLARASWIEIAHLDRKSPEKVVEARKSLVDRNELRYINGLTIDRRGSQEPRGSK